MRAKRLTKEAKAMRRKEKEQETNRETKIETDSAIENDGRSNKTIKRKADKTEGMIRCH